MLKGEVVGMVGDDSGVGDCGKVGDLGGDSIII